MNTNIDYDYDEVINFCKTSAQDDIINLGKDLNSLCKKLASCQDSFHTKEYSIISKIYEGFSTIIGNTNNNSGLSGLMVESANIVNVCYSEAMQDKKIVEEGGSFVSRGLVNGAVAGVAPKKGILGRIGATLGTVGTGFVEGVVKFGETVVDGVTLAGTALLTIPTAIIDAAGAVAAGWKGTDYNPITDDMWKASKGFVCTDYTTGWADSFYDNTSAGQYLKDNSYAFNAVRGVSKFAGEVTAGVVTGTAVTNALSKGASVASAGTSLTTTGTSNLGASLNVIDKTDDVIGIAAHTANGLPGPVASVGTSLSTTGSTAVSTVNTAAASAAGNAASGGVVCEVLDSAGNVIGTTMAREISSTVISSGAKTASSFVPKAAAAGAGVAAAVGGIVESNNN